MSTTDGMSKQRVTRQFWGIVLTIALIHFCASAFMVAKYPEWGPADDDPAVIPPPSLQERVYDAGLNILVLPLGPLAISLMVIMDHCGDAEWSQSRKLVGLGLPLCLNSLFWGIAITGVWRFIRRRASKAAQPTPQEPNGSQGVRFAIAFTARALRRSENKQK